MLEAQLARQKEDLRSFRNQATFCAAINTLIASVFSNFLEKFGLPELTLGTLLGIPVSLWFVLSCFAASLTFSILVVIRFEKVTCDFHTASIMFEIDNDGTYENALRDLIDQGSDFFEENERVIGRVREKLAAALILAFAQVPAWLFYLSSGFRGYF